VQNDFVEPPDAAGLQNGSARLEARKQLVDPQRTATGQVVAGLEERWNPYDERLEYVGLVAVTELSKVEDQSPARAARRWRANIYHFIS
jgi:hypothetical protein